MEGWVGLHSKFKRVLIYNPTDTDNNSVSRMTDQDVVLTTPEGVQRSFPKGKGKSITSDLDSQAAEDELSSPEVLEAWVEDNKDEAGLLHQVHWYRVRLFFHIWERSCWQEMLKIILDEAVSHLSPFPHAKAQLCFNGISMLSRIMPPRPQKLCMHLKAITDGLSPEYAPPCSAVL